MSAHRDRFQLIDAEMARIRHQLREDFPQVFPSPDASGIEVTEHHNAHQILRGNADLVCERGCSQPAVANAPLPIYPEPHHMSHRIAALGVVTSIRNVTPTRRLCAKRSRIGPALRVLGWLSVILIAAVLLRLGAR